MQGILTVLHLNQWLYDKFWQISLYCNISTLLFSNIIFLLSFFNSLSMSSMNHHFFKNEKTTSNTLFSCFIASSNKTDNNTLCQQIILKWSIHRYEIIVQFLLPPLGDDLLTPNNCRPKTWWLNTLRPRQNGRHFADDIFKCIFLNENAWIPIKISLKFVPQGPISHHWFR